MNSSWRDVILAKGTALGHIPVETDWPHLSAQKNPQAEQQHEQVTATLCPDKPRNECDAQLSREDLFVQKGRQERQHKYEVQRGSTTSAVNSQISQDVCAARTARFAYLFEPSARSAPLGPPALSGWPLVKRKYSVGILK